MAAPTNAPIEIRVIGLDFKNAENATTLNDYLRRRTDVKQDFPIYALPDGNAVVQLYGPAVSSGEMLVGQRHPVESRLLTMEWMPNRQQQQQQPQPVEAMPAGTGRGRGGGRGVPRFPAGTESYGRPGATSPENQHSDAPTPQSSYKATPPYRGNQATPPNFQAGARDGGGVSGFNGGNNSGYHTNPQYPQTQPQNYFPSAPLPNSGPYFPPRPVGSAPYPQHSGFPTQDPTQWTTETPQPQHFGQPNYQQQQPPYYASRELQGRMQQPYPARPQAHPQPYSQHPPQVFQPQHPTPSAPPSAPSSAHPSTPPSASPYWRTSPERPGHEFPASVQYEWHQPRHFPSENCILLKGLPQNADGCKVVQIVNEVLSQGRSEGESVEFLGFTKTKDDLTAAKLDLRDRKKLGMMWKQRHKRKWLEYDGHALSFDLVCTDQYIEDRFLVEGIPQGTSEKRLSLHLKALGALEGVSKVSPRYFEDGTKAVVFLDDELVDEKWIDCLNRDGAEFEEDDGTQLRFSRIPVNRSVRITGLGPSVSKPALRNYLFSLRTSPPVLLVEEISISEEDEPVAIVTFRTIADMKAVLKLGKLPALDEDDSLAIEPHSLYPSSARDVPLKKKRSPNAAATEKSVPLSTEPPEIVLKTPKHFDDDIMDFVHADSNRLRRFTLHLKSRNVGDFSWDQQMGTVTITAKTSNSKSEVETEFMMACEQFDKVQLVIPNPELWQKAVNLAEKENLTRGNIIRVKKSPDGTKLWLIGAKSDVTELRSHCAAIISDWQREKEKREAIITDNVPYHTESHLKLLKFNRQYQSLQLKLSLEPNRDFKQIYLKGSAQDVQSAKDTLASLIANIQPKLVSVDRRVWNFFGGPGLEQLAAAINDQGLSALPVAVDDQHPSVCILSVTEHVNAAVKVVTSQFCTQSIKPTDNESLAHLRSQKTCNSLESLCGDLLVQMEGFGDPKAKEFWLTGLVGNVKKASDELNKRLDESVVYERSEALAGKSSLAYLKKFCKDEIDHLKNSLQKFKANISFQESPPCLLMTATRNGLQPLQVKVRGLLDMLYFRNKEFKKHGLNNYVTSRQFKMERTDIEETCKVIISHEEEEYDDAETSPDDSRASRLQSSSTSTLQGCFSSSKDPSRTINLFLGDLCLHQVDAIVSTASEDLKHSGGLARVIAQRAGYAVQAESDKIVAKCKSNRLQPGEAVHTSSGLLTNTKAIIHVVGPRWPGGGKKSEIKKAERILQDGVTSCLKIAGSQNLSSVAFPAIGAGAYGCPSDFVAQNMIQAVNQFLSKNPKSSVKSIDLVMRAEDKANVRSFSEELSRNLKPSTFPRKPPAVPARADASGRSHIKIIVTGGDITQEKVDVIVNSASQDLDMNAAQASKAVARAAGPKLQEECSARKKSSGPLTQGDLFVTSGYQLPAQHVIHMLCPKSPKDLEKVVYSCVKVASDMKLSSVAFPALGTGNLGMADQQAAGALFSAFDRFRREEKCTTIKTLTVVVFDKSKLSVFQSESDNSTSHAYVPPPLPALPVAPSRPSNEAKLHNGCLVRIEQGNAITDTCDVIVATRGVVLQNVLKADSSAQSDWTNNFPNGWKTDGQICVLTTSQLKGQCVYAIAPPSSQADKSDAVNAQTIAKIVESCLTTADSAKYSSIAIPAIGTGGLGYSNAVCANGILEGAKAYASKVPSPSLRLIKVSVFDSNRVSDFQKGLHNYVPSSASSGAKHDTTSLTSTTSSTDIFTKKRKTVKKVSAGEPDSATFTVVGNCEESCDNAIIGLQKAVDENCVRRKYEGKFPTTFDEVSLTRAAKEKGVVLTIDVPPGENNIPVIHVAGRQGDVKDAIIAIGNIFSEGLEADLEDVACEGVSSKVTWQWQADNDSWAAFHKKVNLECEKSYNEGKSTFTVSDGRTKYEVDLGRMVQICDGKQRRIKRQEVLTEGTFEYPPTWISKTDSGQAAIIPVSTSSQEFKDIAGNFTSALGKISATIRKIERIENPMMFQLFAHAKEFLAKKRAKEIASRKAVLQLELYHGTAEHAVQHIVDQGFNRIYAGKAVGKLYGPGVYFAKNSSFSYDYAQPNAQRERKMFLCHVLMGLSTVGNSQLLEPPVIDTSKSFTDRYDSTVNDMTNTTIFVSCYRDHMAYPAYLITFT
eukprot:m.56240 g.56240  ORF g.56240 m.56240 type:complete len:2135 (+) comp34579_c0_seq4:365-6769(+)